MAAIGENLLREYLKNKKIAPVYFIYGKDHYLIRKTVNDISKCVVADNFEFNLINLGSDSDAQQIYDACFSLPMLAEKKCVIVSDYRISKVSANELKKLLSVIEDLCDSTVLIFMFETVEINPKKLTESVKAVIKAVEKNGGVVCQIDFKSESELVRVLCSAAAKRGCNLQPTVARYLINTCSFDLYNLIGELEKVCAYCSETGIITVDDINKICVKSVEASIYSLSKFIVAKNAEMAMKILNDLFFMKINYMVVLTTLSDSYIDMLRVRYATQAGVTPDIAATDFA
ncbi:MAG: DNA polymerase III subunit delta, partial [bacterium]|nr:DNA polymerase III subunit delta [bacterium]